MNLSPSRALTTLALASMAAGAAAATTSTAPAAIPTKAAASAAAAGSAAGGFKAITPPAPVKAMFAANPEVLKHTTFFAGPGNLIGVFVQLPNGQPSIMYVAPDAKIVIAGQAIEVATKRNLTAEAAVQFAPNSKLGKTGADIIRQTPVLTGEATGGAPMNPRDDPVPAADVTPAKLAKLNYVETGNGERVLYVFVDPLCIHCKNAYEEIRAWQKKGNQTRVRWVPISLGSDEATGLAAYALGNKSEPALAAMFAKQADATATERITKGALLLETNMTFSQDQIPMHATPTFVYVDGGKVVAKTGYAGLLSLAAPNSTPIK